MAKKETALAYISTGMTASIYSDAFILFIFLTMQKKILTFGGFFSLSLLVVALINFFIGAWVDKRGKRGLIVMGSFSSLLIWIGRFLTNSVGALFIFDIFDRITGGMLSIPLEVLSFEKAVDGNSTGRALLFREFAITGGSILANVLLIFIVGFGLDLRYSFLAAVAFSLFPLFMITKKGVYGEP